MKRISQFRFKRFAVWHHRSALKVGVDGVLVGCWTRIGAASSVLDVGTGCGLIALIMAQRDALATVTGIDIDMASVEEAKENVEASPWKDRIHVVHGNFPSGLAASRGGYPRFDLVVSNPPFFNSGVSDAATPREIARHQGALSPLSVLAESVRLLMPGGSVALIAPAEFSSALEDAASALGYSLARKCIVRGHPDAPYKRVLLQWIFMPSESGSIIPELEELTLESSPGIPTDRYRSLCKDFYLKF